MSLRPDDPDSAHPPTDVGSSSQGLAEEEERMSLWPADPDSDSASEEGGSSSQGLAEEKEKKSLRPDDPDSAYPPAEVRFQESLNEKPAEEEAAAPDTQEKEVKGKFFILQN